MYTLEQFFGNSLKEKEKPSSPITQNLQRSKQPVVLYKGLFKDKENEETTLYIEDTFLSSRAQQSWVTNVCHMKAFTVCIRAIIYIFYELKTNGHLNVSF